MIAFFLDQLGMDTPSRYLPVVWLERLVQWVVRGVDGYRFSRGSSPYVGGVVVLVLPVLVVWGIVKGRGMIPEFLHVLVDVWCLVASFTFTGLGRTALSMAQAVDQGDVGRGQSQLRNVSDEVPEGLSGPDLSAVTIQWVVEKVSNSFVAPLFFYLLFGLSGVVFYQVVRSLYEAGQCSEGYSGLDKASCRCYELLNYIPARMTAGLLLIAGKLHGASIGEGLRIWQRDGRRTPSMNAGQPIAVMAGLLGVRLEKLGIYGLGDPHTELNGRTIRQAWVMAETSGWLAFGIGFVCLRY
ncbi:MAG: cobalamin biosynthesis protein [Myxococcales bacterium]|nr:cobalamin biosynthesis protein [Myxococcales bacterium]